MDYKWKDARRESGIDNLPEVPPLRRVCYAYKSGEVREFDSVEQAESFSKNVETKYISSAERDAIIELRAEYAAVAFDLWYKNLMKYWSRLPYDVFCVCYDNAYERGHSSGYDEVANCMYNAVAFAEKIATSWFNHDD